jgi:hypothetical protein
MRATSWVPLLELSGTVGVDGSAFIHLFGRRSKFARLLVAGGAELGVRGARDVCVSRLPLRPAANAGMSVANGAFDDGACGP